MLDIRSKQEIITNLALTTTPLNIVGSSISSSRHHQFMFIERWCNIRYSQCHATSWHMLITLTLSISFKPFVCASNVPDILRDTIFGRMYKSLSLGFPLFWFTIKVSCFTRSCKYTFYHLFNTNWKKMFQKSHTSNKVKSNNTHIIL